MQNQLPITTAKRILIVEDDRAISQAIKMLLVHYEFAVTIAPTLAEAKRCLPQKPDLVILDVQLPDGDGLDFLQLIRETAGRTRVFVLTGTSTPVTEMKLKRLKPDRYFRKPFNFIEILEAIRPGLEDEQPVSSGVKSLF